MEKSKSNKQQMSRVGQKMTPKTEKGITLVALVITIVLNTFGVVVRRKKRKIIEKRESLLYNCIM